MWLSNFGGFSYPVFPNKNPKPSFDDSSRITHYGQKGVAAELQIPEIHIPSKGMQCGLSLTETTTSESLGVFPKKTIELFSGGAKAPEGTAAWVVQQP